MICLQRIRKVRTIGNHWLRFITTVLIFEQNPEIVGKIVYDGDFRKQICPGEIRDRANMNKRKRLNANQ